MPAVIADDMAVLHQITHEVRFIADIVAREEKCRLDLIFIEHIRDLLDIRDVVSAFIEGEIDHFLIRSDIIRVICLQPVCALCGRVAGMRL